MLDFEITFADGHKVWASGAFNIVDAINVVIKNQSKYSYVDVVKAICTNRVWTEANQEQAEARMNRCTLEDSCTCPDCIARLLVDNEMP